MTPVFFALALLAAISPAGSTAGAAGGSSYSSHLMVDQEVLVSSRITGIIETISVDRGSPVVKGQPLATLDQREAVSEVRQAKEDMELRRAEFERQKTLSGFNLGSVADLDTARARHAVASAAFDKARTLRDYTVIRAPFKGVVTDKLARVGQKVVDIQNQPLFKVTALEPLLARIYVPDRDLAGLKRGDSVDVVAANAPSVRASARVEYISPTVDAGSATVAVIVRVGRNPAPAMFRPGVAVEVRLPASRRP
ncbi:MAG: efflux RND transporter periplasmic adaptor subunit [Acidobacteriota bacterium]